MSNNPLMSSKNEKWETPPSLFNPLKDEFDLVLDVCASAENSKTDRFFSMEDNGLLKSWGRNNCWMNPPYGNQVSKWVKKAYSESLKGALVVCLLAARTDTRWFHDYILGKSEIRFIKGRVKFVGAKYTAPFPSMIVIFQPFIGYYSELPLLTNI